MEFNSLGMDVWCLRTYVYNTFANKILLLTLIMFKV